MAESSTQSSGSSSSTSTPSILPQDQQVSDFLLNLANYSQGLGAQTMNWANGVWGKTSALNDQVVNNYMGENATAIGMAQNDLKRYQQTFQPQEDALIRDANTYASPDRIKADMGMAESGQAQAGDAALANARRSLQSYGIDPSAGRYQSLETAERTKQAAAAAGAAQQQRISDENTGRALRSEAIQVGQRYPGQVINEMNTGLQALQGASNSSLATANTGVNLMKAADPYLSTAASAAKFPPSVANTTSHSSNQGSGSSSSPSGSSGSGSGSGSNPSYGGSGNTGDFMNPSNYDSNGAGMGGGIPGGADGMGSTPGASSDGGWGMGEGAMTGNSPYDTSSNGNDYGPDMGGGFGAPVDDSSGDGSFSMGFAAGGAIPDGPSTGGYVPPSASPSGGMQTDDVNAHLNADEFVLPKDIVKWKGQEFFQKLIEQSRQAMAGAPAKGKPAPAQSGPASFVSRAA